jgi:hypothetical protein
MTTTPSPASPTPEGAKVTELEQKLADAAAEVAKVQTELSHARAADPNHPQVPVPYDGHAPVVMINGQQVPAGGTVDLTAMLGGMFGGATSAALANAAATPGAQVVNIPPVIAVNGQVYGPGQTVDLSQVIGPEALAQVRSSLEQLGMGGFASMFGGAAAAGAVGAASPPPSMSQPGPAPAVYSTSPGEVTSSGNKLLLWLAAALVIGLIAVLIYLAATN